MINCHLCGCFKEEEDIKQYGKKKIPVCNGCVDAIREIVGSIGEIEMRYSQKTMGCTDAIR